MPLQLPSVPFNLNAQSFGVPDLQAAIQKGLQSNVLGSQADILGTEAQYAPQKTAEAILSQQLQNKLNTHRLKYAEPLSQLELQLKKAQIQKALQPSKPTGNLANLFALRNSLPEGSEDRKLADQAIQNAVATSQGTQLSVGQNGEITFSQGGKGGAKPSSQIIYDENGNAISVSPATTPTSTSQQQAGIANIGREFIGENYGMPYVGLGATFQLGNDLKSYVSKSSDPKTKSEAENRLIQAVVAYKTIPELSGLQLTSQRIRPTVTSLEHQKEINQAGWPLQLSRIIDNYPKELLQKANSETNEAIKKIKEAEENYQAKGFPVRIGTNKPTLKKRTFKNSQEFKQYLSTLTPEQINEAKRIYLGNK